MTLIIIGIVGILCCAVWFVLFGRKKPKKSMVFGVLAALAVFVLALFLSVNGTETPSTGSVPVSSSSASVPSSSVAVGKPYQAEFIGGYYTPGIDFPAGTYNITVLDGNGQVYYTSPSGGGKTEALGINGTKQLQKVDLPLGEALSITGLKIRIESDAADTAELSERENTATKTVTLGSGTYRVGEQLEDGVYDVTALNGIVKFDSDSEGAVCHETLNAQGKDFEKGFKNLLLDVGTSITVSGGTVQLIPSK